ncbi:MFS transporter [Streptomyces brasiliscabiei]|uniref:MFS transporter n=1 Tax=Streptomyces brasiliscabiei TaxID=2736302 RepID=UPI001C10D9C3|nr:MFS transporter [Streptomyces brasiliscabiei]
MTAPSTRPGTARTAETGTPPDPRRWWALVVIALAQLMVILDATIVNIALPSAQRDLAMSDGDRQWVITSYTLAFGGLLLLGGRISDLLGRRRAFVIGLAGFAVASALGGAASSSGTLFAARALQGVFAAVLAPSALSLLTTTFADPAERGKAFGVYGAIAGSGSAIGLISGGLLTEYLDWRWCLYVNVPIAVAALVGAAVLLPDHPARTGARLDIPGALLGSAGLTALVYGFAEAEPRGWTDTRVLVLLAAGTALLTGFVLWQRRAPHPLLPLRLVKDRDRAGCFLTISLATVGMFGMFLFMTYYFQVVLAYSPVRTGLAFLPLTAAIITGSTQISARLMQRVPPRRLMVPGTLLAATGMLILTRLTVDSAYTTAVLPALILMGLGMGMTFMPVFSTATAGVAPEDAGITSAALNTAQQVGGSLGTALLNTIATTSATAYLATHPARESVVHGYTTALWWAAAILALASVTAATMITARAPQRTAA